MRSVIPLLAVAASFACACESSDETTTGTTLPVCAEYVPPANGPTCRSVADCKSSRCFGWNEKPTCPYPPECSGDYNCPADRVCENTGCTNNCVPKCTAGACPSGTVCGADGHCQPPVCNTDDDCGPVADCDPTASGVDVRGCLPHSCTTGGYACPPNRRCNPTLPDGHGCSPLDCAVDADCDCGVCWNGTCEAGPGWCGDMLQ